MERGKIACYKNSVRAWRTGAQTDLSEVLQIENVFTNVSKGQVAPAADIEKAFGTTDTDKVVLEILKKGELQVGEKERALELEDKRREIATEVAGRCVDPATQRPHTVGMIEKAMAEIGYSVHPTKPAKAQVRLPACLRMDPSSLTDEMQQALDLIKQLQSQKTLSIARAQMRVRLTMPSKNGKKIKDKILALTNKVEDDEWSDEWELVALIDPGSFRLLDELLTKEAKGSRLETLSFAAAEEDDHRIE